MKTARIGRKTTPPREVTIPAFPSKSEAHRLLIAAALSGPGNRNPMLPAKRRYTRHGGLPFPHGRRDHPHRGRLLRHPHSGTSGKQFRSRHRTGQTFLPTGKRKQRTKNNGSRSGRASGLREGRRGHRRNHDGGDKRRSAAAERNRPGFGDLPAEARRR